MAEKTYLHMCLKLGRPSLLRPTGTVCGLSGTTLPVIGETEIKIENTGTISVLVTKDFPHEILLGSDALTQGQGKIDYAERRMTWFGRYFKIIPYTDSLPYTASIYDSCGHPGFDEVMRQYTDVFDCPTSVTATSLPSQSTWTDTAPSGKEPTEPHYLNGTW